VAVQFRFTIKVVVLVKIDEVRFAETVTAGRTGGYSVAYRVVVSVYTRIPRISISATGGF
jgi:hypothetical protein